METIQINNITYRIKKMNAIELLAMRAFMSFSSVEDLLKSYNALLEKVEVNIKNDDWIQVRQGNNYYPVGIEEDVDTIDKLVAFVLNYLKEVFHLSNKSNK